MTIILLRLKFQLLEKKTLWIGSERNSLRSISGQLLGFLFCVAPFVGYKAASVRIGMHIFAKLTKQSSYKSTHLAMLERDDKKEQPPDKLFLWHFIKLLPIFINNFFIFFQKKRMLKRGEWVTVSEEQSVSSSGERRTRRQFATFHCLCKTSPSLATTSVTSTLPAFSKYILAMLPLLSYKYMFGAVVTQRNCSLEKKMI